MFNKNKKNIKTLDKDIADLIKKLESDNLESEERYALDDRLEKLVNCRKSLYDKAPPNPIVASVVTGLFGLAGIALVLYYEETEVVTSKAYNVASRMIGG